MANAQQFLTQTAASLRRMTSKVDRLDGLLVEQDIAARRIEADIGWEFAKAVDRIESALKTTRSNRRLDQWVKEHCGCDIQTMRRRKRLYKLWKQYETARRKLGECGSTGLEFALSLVMERPTSATNERGSTVRSVARTISRPASKTAPVKDDRVEFITGDALIQLPKLAKKSVQCIVTSPPYWPIKRGYGGTGIGYEKNLNEYVGNLVTIFHEARDVLRDDGILWVVIDDAYSKAGGLWHLDPKSPAMLGLQRQETRDIRDLGNLLLIPTRFALKMQDDGWCLRAEIIRQKINYRPNPVKDRPNRNYEKVLMFSKSRRYYYDADPIREPRIGKGNPIGRNAGSVWPIDGDGYSGHPATMPSELVRQCLLVSCPENSLVLDCFGGAGTTAMAALELGHRAISIDINPAYTREARERLEAA